MGMYDTVEIEDGVDVSFPGLDTAPTRIEWQTKTFRRPALEVYKVTMDGRLYKEDADYETVPEEDRPGYDEERGSFENDWQKGWGMLNKVREGWSDTDHHGILEIHSVVDDEYISYDLKFTDGTLVDITLNE